jgi:hypothetical protein
LCCMKQQAFLRCAVSIVKWYIIIPCSKETNATLVYMMILLCWMCFQGKHLKLYKSVFF